MGIRESLKEAQPEKLHNFTVPEEEPKKELEFDAEREIGSNWEELKDLGHKNASDYNRYLDYVTNLLILFPDRHNELITEFKKYITSEEMKRLFQYGLRQWEKDGFVSQDKKWNQVIHDAAKFKMIFPDQKSEFKAEFTAEDLQKIDEQARYNFQQFKQGFILRRDFLYLVNFKIFFPERLPEIDLNELFNGCRKNKEIFRTVFLDIFPNIGIARVFQERKK